MANSYFRRVAAVAVLCAGCGGGPADPFERVHVQGTVAVSGEPVEFGSISFTGASKEKTSEVALAIAPIRNGQFNTEEGGRGASPGMNEVSVTVYDGDPDSTERETKMLGSWLGQQEIGSGEPIQIDIPADDLVK